MAYLTQEELNAMGFAKLGRNVLLSTRAVIYGAARIEISDNCRIDDFCLFSAGEGGIKIGRHVHVACFVTLIGSAEIELCDFSGVSGRAAIYSSSDDFSGDCLTGPTIDPKYTNVKSAPVRLGRHAVVSAGAIVLPGVEIGDGSIIGALSLVTKNCDEFSIYTGVPARFLKARSRKLLELEQEFLARPHDE